jgi:hypothetical protein
MLFRHRVLHTVAFVIVALAWAHPLFAQEGDDEDSRINTNLAFPITIPVGQTGKFAKLGTGVVTGVGYNFNQHNAFVGEFMWNWLYPTKESLAPLRTALESTDLKGHSNQFALTANYRFEMRGRRLGVYLIGGGGLYYRNASLSRAVTVPPGTACTPAWFWWGFSCSSGIVVVNQVHSSFSSAVPGGNAGAGFTIQLHESRYRLYFEARYHYAPSSPFTTRMIPITTGIRF